MEAKRLCEPWQGLLERFRGAFTAPGWQRFAEWVTGLALNVVRARPGSCGASAVERWGA